MSSQIAVYKLDHIRKVLITDKYEAKKKALEEMISQLIYDTVNATIPDVIKEVFAEQETEYINYDPTTMKFRPTPKWFKTCSYFYTFGTSDLFELVNSYMRSECIDYKSFSFSMHIDFPTPLPCADTYVNNIVRVEISKKGELYELFKQYALLQREIKTLDNKIKCLFSSKRFYPGTLKNEFPEAYTVFEKAYGNTPKKTSDTKEDASLCDSIESIRATLSSKK